jgi:hypothetical protein
MNKIKFLYLSLFTLIIIGMSCSLTEPQPAGGEVIRQDGKIFVKDQTGKMWDITHAVDNYGFDPAVFAHGLGPNAIRPIQNPKMLRSGDPGYPGSNSEIVVLGASLAGDSRAYPLSILIRHEIANESFGNVHVSVAY